MNTSEKQHYLFLFREPADAPTPAPEEMQKIVGQWMAWMEKLKTQGRYIAGNRLEDPQKMLRGTAITDGPFAETKEVINGYFIVEADDLKHAGELARGCPGLPFGISVEVRPLMQDCK